MDILTLTSEIKNLLGFDSAFITVDNKDFMIQIKQLNSKLIIFTCPFYDFKYGQTIKITIKTENDNLPLTIPRTISGTLCSARYYSSLDLGLGYLQEESTRKMFQKQHSTQE